MNRIPLFFRRIIPQEDTIELVFGHRNIVRLLRNGIHGISNVVKVDTRPRTLTVGGMNDRNQERFTQHLSEVLIALLSVHVLEELERFALLVIAKLHLIRTDDARRAVFLLIAFTIQSKSNTDLHSGRLHFTLVFFRVLTKFNVFNHTPKGNAFRQKITFTTLRSSGHIDISFGDLVRLFSKLFKQHITILSFRISCSRILERQGTAPYYNSILCIAVLPNTCIQEQFP